MSTQQLGGLKVDGELRALIVRGQEMGFLGLEEVAEVLDISRATAQRDWEVARTFLFQALR